MQNYKYELLNSRTQRYFSKGLRNSTLKGLQLEDTTSLKDAQLTKFMYITTWNYGHETTRLDDLHNNMESCIRLFSFSYLLSQNLVQINS
ncbi:hypothetical protein MTR67_023426 [Solanum verrucosum]|uniref:Uncharacterized protein n=1 Tax=Solanum verrucosum TaxID=315347 RepID=A0AAF0R0Z4_SOLVR|nr:hypothetical protein MTR67_023426 [Solanum verrucosum]